MVLGPFRLPFQPKTFHVVAIVWVLVLIGSVYKLWEPKQRVYEPVSTIELFDHFQPNEKTKRIFKICNHADDITSGDEGILEPKKWILKGILVIIRHGDRGPLQHIRNISNVDCSVSENDMLSSYKNYLHNLTSTGKALWVGPGSFHGFPLLPTHAKNCMLGQLSMQGVSQLLNLGNVLRNSYGRVWPKLSNLTYGDILVYSTRYRRTFQSALAFLYGVISPETLSKLAIVESQSMNFCFKDCGCQITDKYAKLVQKGVNYQLKSHPAVGLLAASTGRVVFSPMAERGPYENDPYAVRDALLTYICHGSPLPCENTFNCIRRRNVVGIFTYIDWVNQQKWKSWDWRRLCLLKSYGLIRHIVSQMLAMISNGPYFVLYSGHDHTVDQLAGALGLQNDPLLLRYASRIIFEMYYDGSSPKGSAADLFFRLLTNGKDVTRQVMFCKNVISIGNNISLCKIENIVRFLHDDYFSIFNVTNYKDACFVKR